MRSFATDAPEFFCFHLEGDETIYKIPLAASMPASVVLKVQDGFEGQFSILKEYMGEGADKVITKQVGEIIFAWLEASKGQGASVGES